MRPFFREVSRRQVCCDPFRGQCKAQRRYSGANAFTALSNGFIGKAHNGETDHPRGDLALDFDVAGFQANIRDCGND